MQYCNALLLKVTFPNTINILDSKIITIMLDQLQYLEINVYAVAWLYNDYSIHIIKTISFICL